MVGQGHMAGERMGWSPTVGENRVKGGVITWGAAELGPQEEKCKPKEWMGVVKGRTQDEDQCLKGIVRMAAVLWAVVTLPGHMSMQD